MKEEIGKVKRESVGNEKREEKKLKEETKKTKSDYKIGHKRKFIADYKEDSKGHSAIIKLLEETNDKVYGRKVMFKDLVDFALTKVISTDIEKIRSTTYSEMDKVLMQLEKFNLKHNTNLELGEYLVKQLKI